MLRIGFIGAGKVSGALARLWDGAGVKVRAIYSRTDANAVALAGAVGAEHAASVAAVVAACDLTLLTVPDDAIRDVSVEISSEDVAGKMIVHTSGVYDASVLNDLAMGGAVVGSFHPAYPFADPITSANGVRGAAFAIEAEDERLRSALTELVGLADGRAIHVPPGGKAAYHAGLVIVSNYTVTLYAVAERLLRASGANADAAQAALVPLVRASVENLVAQGIPDALTGPLVRGDTGTIVAHLNALDTETAVLYRALGRATLPLAERRDLDSELLAQLAAILDDKKAATDATKNNPRHPEDEGSG